MKRLTTTAELLYQLAIDEADNRGRGHLGASGIGEKCARKLFYSFRWVSGQKFSGRILRLFRRGHLEETFITADLANIPGVHVKTIDPVTGDQFRFFDPEFPGFAGSVDGIVFGLPELPDEWIGLEVKTHNDKNFKAIKKHGVKKAFPKHYAQTQSYMFGLGLPAFLHLSVNKNTDEIYTELVHYSATDAEDIRATARHVLESKRPPAKISKRADWYECKPAFCSHSEICHFKAKPVKSCRSCEFVDYHERSNKWTCTKQADRELELEAQRAGCDLYEIDQLIRNAG